MIITNRSSRFLAAGKLTDLARRSESGVHSPSPSISRMAKDVIMHEIPKNRGDGSRVTEKVFGYA
jgi:hypothetical protein